MQEEKESAKQQRQNQAGYSNPSDTEAPKTPTLQGSKNFDTGFVLFYVSVFLHESLNCSSYSHFSTINVKSFFENGLFEPLKVKILKKNYKINIKIQAISV